tara:strand:+ start:206 stop:1042 length:837 start_codon:yes stop_codon:yes gene_type:complete
MTWRVIDLGKTSIYRLHATEDYFLEKVNKGKQPTILFSKIKKAAISIGSKQNLKKDLNTANAHDLGVDITRRKTGGRSIYLDENHYILSLINKKKPSDLDITKKYESACSTIIETIRDITGIELYLKNNNDLMTAEDRKVGGAAQRGKTKSYLVHCYLRYQEDIDSMLELIMIDGKELKSYRPEFENFVSSIKTETKNNSIDFYSAFQKNFLDKMVQEDYKNRQLSENEMIEIICHAKNYKKESYILGTGEEPSRGNCDLIAGKTLRIKDLEGKVQYV